LEGSGTVQQSNSGMGLFGQAARFAGSFLPPGQPDAGGKTRNSHYWFHKKAGIPFALV
jgi:hypothetical protein